MVETTSRRRLAAVLSADVVGYSRLMQDDESATVETLQDYRAAIGRVVARHDGRVVNAPGDNILAEFPSAMEAVRAAIEIQQNVEGRNAELAEPRRMHFRIGINLGDVIEAEDGTIYGDGVNIAARMEALAEAGGVCISSPVHDALAGKVAFGFDFLGEQRVKNIAQPIRVYRVRSEPHGRKGAAVRLSRMRWRPAAAVAFFAGLGLIGAWLIVSRPPTDREAGGAPAIEDRVLPPPGKPSIAVLPFKNLGGDAERDYFAEGIAEDIITDLSRISGLFVIARNSSFGIVDRMGDAGDGLQAAAGAAAAASELNVRYVLQGSVRRSDEQVRINVQLLDAESGQHIWADRYDRGLTDVFAVQDEIAAKVVAALEVELTDVERQRMAGTYTENMQAYDLFLRGRRLQGGVTREESAEARALIEQAIALDPSFAAAYAELSWIETQTWYYEWTEDPEQTIHRAVSMAERAVALDGTLAAAHARLGWAYLPMRRYDEAIESARKALALDPNYGDGYLILSEILIYSGLAEEGIRLAREGIPLDPYLTYHHLLHIANGYLVLGDHAQAIATAKRSIEHNPDWPGPYIWLAALYGQLGPREEAGRMFVEVRRRIPDFSIERRRQIFVYRNQTLGDWMVEGLKKASAAVES